jgi:DNA-binding NtrC family response regulator
MEIVILTGHGTIDSAVEATRSGAYSYLQKPCDLDTLMGVVVEAFKKRVMNKQQLKNKKMDELLKIAQGRSAREILSRLREINQKGS